MADIKGKWFPPGSARSSPSASEWARPGVEGGACRRGQEVTREALIFEVSVEQMKSLQAFTRGRGRGGGGGLSPGCHCLSQPGEQNHTSVKTSDPRRCSKAFRITHSSSRGNPPHFIIISVTSFSSAFI